MTDLSHAVWRKSQNSQNNGACVEVADLAAHVGVRDSKNPTGSMLSFKAAAWTSFLTGVKANS